MFYIPDHILIGTDKYESVLANKSVFSIDDHKLRKMVKFEGMEEICYRPTKHSSQSIVTEKTGFIFYAYLTQKLLDMHKLGSNEAFIYLELVGEYFYLLMVQSDGVVASETLTQVLHRKDQKRVNFDSDALDLIIGRVTEFSNRQESIVRAFVSTSQHIDAELFFNESLNTTAQERLKSYHAMNQSGVNLIFSLNDEGKEGAFLDTGILAKQKQIYMPFAQQTRPFLSSKIVSLLNSNEDVLVTELLPSKFKTRSIRSYTKRKNIGRFVMGGVVATAIAALYIPPYLEELRKQEELANKIVTVKRTVDEFEVYRNLILKDGLNAEMSLKQIALALSVFEENRNELQWFPVQINAKTTNVSFTMSSFGEGSLKIADFAKRNGLVHFYNNDQHVLGYGLKHYAINSEVYRPPVDDDIRFLEETIDYMFDYTTMSIGQRTSHENWSSVLVNVNFNCWLPQTFEYFSTQLYPRNFGFASIEAAWSDRADADGKTLVPCGYSGKLQIEVYGHQGKGLSISTTSEEENI